MFCQILEIPGTLVNHFLLDFIVSIIYVIIHYTLLFSAFLIIFQKERRKIELSFLIVPSTIFAFPHMKNSQE